MNKLPNSVKTSGEKRNLQNGLSKIEGIITSSIKLKELKEGQSYFWAFFQLEGLNQDIPVIFKIDSSVSPSEQTLPPIPPRSKVLLEGKWSESPNSTRPSFTCLAFEIISGPPPITIKSLREQISSLLTTSLEKQSEWKQRTDYLFKRIETLKDLEKLTKLGDKYLSAYLLLKSAHYANYQDNLLSHTGNLVYQEEYLAKISSEIEEVAQHIRAYEAKEI